jgi:hypothetical protein
VLKNKSSKHILHLYMKLVFAASQLSMHHKGVRAKTGWLCRVDVYPRTVVSVSQHYKSQAKHVRLAQSGHDHHLIET